jgi:hypothetical protein
MKRILLGLVATMVFGATLWWAMNTTSKIRASASWPATDGEVISAAVARDSTRIRGGGYNHFFRADITYRYRVNGKAYESDTFMFGVPHSFSNQAEAESEVSTYAVGRHVEVHYDPANPASATIHTGTVPEQFRIVLWMAGAGTLAGVLAVLSGFLSRRKRRRG